MWDNGDNGKDLPQILEQNCGINKLRIQIINNSSSKEAISTLINQFVDTIITFEAHRLRETEPILKIRDIETQDELEHN